MKPVTLFGADRRNKLPDQSRSKSSSPFCSKSTDDDELLCTNNPSSSLSSHLFINSISRLIPHNHTMVKLTEVEDEHFSQEKPEPTKDNVLLASDDEDEDFTDTG